MSDEPRPQAGALPFRRISGGRIEILLITPHGADAWRVPCSPVEPGADETRLAVTSAWEEAGVRGRVVGAPLGSYVYRCDGGHARIRVFALEVDEIAGEWNAGTQLDRRWFRGRDAIGEIGISGLREVVRRFLDQGPSAPPS